MRDTFTIPLLLALAGLAAGAALWFSGADLALTHWLNAHTTSAFNTATRVAGWFGLGRNQLIICLLAGLWLGLASRPNPVATRLRLARHWLTGIPHQLWLALRGHGGTTPCWRGLPHTARVWWLAVVSFMLAGGLQLLLKIAVGRPRPKEILWNNISPTASHPFQLDAGFWSFPSGHTTSTFAILVVLMLGFPRHHLALLTLATLLSASRFLAITPHFLGDVVAGAALGSAVALYVVRLANKGLAT